LSPAILRIGPYRFFFYSSDKLEPPNIHVENQGNVAKIWLEPVRLQNSGGFKRNEIQELVKMVEEHSEEFRRVWDEYFLS
jgi:hypothetical protein